MIVGDFYLDHVAIYPFEADPVLLVDPDTVLTLTVSAQLFKLV